MNHLASGLELVHISDAPIEQTYADTSTEAPVSKDAVLEPVEIDTLQNQPPAPYPDQHLLAQAQAGNTEAFTELVNKHNPWLQQFITRLVGPNDAEDVAQEVFLRAYTSLGKIEDRGRGIGPWLTTTARRICIDNHRKAEVRPFIPTDPHSLEFETEVKVGSNTDVTALGHLSMVDLFGAIPRADFRTALYLQYVEGRSVREIAAEMDVPVGTAKSRCHYGRLAAEQLLKSGEVELG